MKAGSLFATLLICLHLFAQQRPEPRTADKIRIREAMAISDRYGDQLFKGYSKVPFAIILVTDSTEFLMNHPNPSPDFILSGYDSVLQTNIYYRKTRFNTHFLATFPAVNGLSCIVVGTPENTHKNSTEWIITLLHEHFHQYQNAYPDYYKSVNRLELSGGDQSGMWMLNYPFPYDSLTVKKQYELYTKALYKTITTPGKKAFKLNLAAYPAERKKFKAVLPPAAYRYFSFQIWQEGLARHMEHNILTLLTNHTVSNEILALPDFISFAALASKMYRNETENLLNNTLQETKRVCFYSTGFAEGIVLSKLNKSWRKKYLLDKFYIEHYSKKIRRGME
ncbi:hypothetical protein [Ferruginibacter profundus]